MAPLEEFREVVLKDMVDRFDLEARSVANYTRLAIIAAVCFSCSILLLFVGLHRVTVGPLLAARKRVIDLSNDDLAEWQEKKSSLSEVSSLLQALAVLRERLVERRNVLVNLERTTWTDALTGLMSRTYFERRMKEEAEVGRPDAFGVIYVDIDRFKEVNDTLGHQVGDRLLEGIGRCFQSLSSDDVLVGRLGGDEFAMLCLRSSRAEREDIALDILRMIAKVHEALELPVNVTASIGLSTGDPSRKPYLELCREADVALYCSKAKGRNTFTWYDLPLNLHPAAIRASSVSATP